LQKVIQLSLFTMNKRVIWIVSICMGLAMAALISVQAFWLKNAWLVKEKQFDQLISRSMIDIEREIERREATDLIIHEDSHVTRDTGLFTFSVPGTSGDPVKPSGISKNPKDMKIDPTRKKQLNEWLKDRREFVDRVVAGLFLKSPEIEKRISAPMLEEVIRDVFKDNGIDLHFEYAVIRFNNEIAFGSGSYDPAEEAEYYRVQLFPEDVFANANSLSIYFPDKRNFMFKSLSYLAISSLLLTLAIVASFAITILVMFRQKRLSEIRNDFVSNMTHELKTPISTISLASQMLGDKSIPPEIKNTEQISKIIAEECRRLGSQVEKVLQTSVFDKGKLRLRLVEVDMHEVISGVMENFSIQVKSRNGKISAALNAENCLVDVDQVHITNVLSNLLDNAIKYSNRNPEIRIETADKGEFFLISISDNGIGISKADQKRVFEKFYRVPTGNVHTVKGFGLGLSYVKMIIEEHHGFVELDSELYEGSTFKLYLPLKDHGEHTKDKNSAG
jgi:two-component system, OmpR family, phosphate regulon sensor histidine kinase PhoR